jgi:subtilisin family serine protease
MTKDIGILDDLKGKIYQSYSSVVDWRTTVNIDLDKYGEGEDVRVLIIGSGLDTHMDLNVGGGYNLSTINPYTLSDFNGHSTFIAGIIAGNGNHYIRGIAPKAQVNTVRIIDKKEDTNFRTLETALLWAKDNFASVVFLDLELFNTIPLTIKKIIASLENNKVPVFISGHKNKNYDFTCYESNNPLNSSCWIDNLYKTVENTDYSLAVATGLAALLKGKNNNLSVDEIYSEIDSILFPKKQTVKSKRTK